MKILKWLLCIVLVLVALVLVIALILPSTVTVSAEKEVAVTPLQVFHNAALFTDRNLWDPWLETEPEADFTIESNPDYAGSTYTWNGKKIKTGRMQVDSVVFGKYIASSIYFGENPEPNLVEWTLDKTDSGTMIEWAFTAEGTYPMGRLFLTLMKGGMLESFNRGLENLKAYLEENPPVLSSLGEIETGTVGPMSALVIGAKGTMDQFALQMSEMFPKLSMEVDAQGLQMAGPPFTHYLTYDEATGITEYLCGIQVTTEGTSTGEIMAKAYTEIPVIKAMHTGPYEEFERSYKIMMEYFEREGLTMTMEAFEFYYTDPRTEPLTTKWQTLIAMPLK
jgi:effector-binding domain-containing protein